MPKKNHKIESFAGGLNNQANPRDIAEDELAEIHNVSVDEVGAIRQMSRIHENHNYGAATDSSWPGNTPITQGSGFHYMSHDRLYGNLGQHLAFAGPGNYNGTTGDGVNSSTGDGVWTQDQNLSWTDGTNVDIHFYNTYVRFQDSGQAGDYGDDALLEQLPNDRNLYGVSNQFYVLEYEILGLTNPESISEFRVYGGSTDEAASGGIYFFAYPQTLKKELGYHYAIIKSRSISIQTTRFSIYYQGSEGGVVATTLSIGRMRLLPFNPPATGSNYLFLGEAATSQYQLIYSDGGSVLPRWSEGLQKEFVNDDVYNDFTHNYAYYYINGALRYCNANFEDGVTGRSTTPRWYGFIDRNLLPDPSGSYFSQVYSNWEEYPAAIPKPSAFWETAGFITGYDSVDPDYEPLWNDPDGDYYSISRTTIDNYITEGSVGALKLQFKLTITGSDNRATGLNLLDGTGYPLDDGSGHVMTVGFGTTSSDQSFDTIQQNYYNEFHPFGTLTHDEVSAVSQNNDGCYEAWLWLDPAMTDVDNSDWTKITVGILSEYAPGDDYTNVCDWQISGMKVYKAGNSADLKTIIGDNTESSTPVVIRTEWDTHTEATGWSGLDAPKRWQFGASFIYDGGQESQLAICNATQGSGASGNLTDSGNIADFQPAVDGTDTQCPKVEISLRSPTHSPLCKRLTGANIYIRSTKGGTGESAGHWFFAYRFDFMTRYCTVMSTGYKQPLSLRHSTANDDHVYWAATIAQENNLSPPQIITYSENSGLFDDEESITAAFKTAVVANRRVWIGNLKIDINPLANEPTVYRPDGMIGSPVGKPDVFPYTAIDEIVTRDGDEIIKLETYADRLLQFKKNKMFLINIAENGQEYLEDTFLYKGIDHRHNSCLTDFGVAWINRFGVYLYDGENVVNLFEKKDKDDNITMRISKSFWEHFTSNLANCQIGYVPDKRQLLMAGLIGQDFGYKNDAMLYDLNTKAWIGCNLMFDYADNGRTNMINDKDGKLIWVESTSDSSTTIKFWDDSKFMYDGTNDGTGSLSLKTGMIDFGAPGLFKKIYKVYLTIEGQWSNTAIKYMVNGSDSTNLFRQGADIGTLDTDISTSSHLTPFGSISSDTSRKTKVLYPHVPSVLNNVTLFQLYFYGTVSSTDLPWRLHDITIVYRLKNVK